MNIYSNLIHANYSFQPLNKMDARDMRSILKLALNSIREFDGKNTSVFEYIDECQEALTCIDPSMEHIFVKFFEN